MAGEEEVGLVLEECRDAMQKTETQGSVSGHCRVSGSGFVPPSPRQKLSATTL